MTVDVLESAMRDFPDVKDYLEDIDETLVELNRLGELLDGHCRSESGEDLAPSFYNIKNTLETCQRTMRVLSGVGDAESEETEGELEDEAVGGAGNATSAVSGTISNRKDAYQALEKLASFFEKTEPHSPVGPALRGWANTRTMVFTELMKHLIDDEGARADLFRRTGVPAPDDDDDDD